MPDIPTILRQYWGFDSFRPLQEDIINSVLQGKDTLALMPTGGGKSLCYQVPALAKDGICLVISPLIALMKDQVENLRKKNITAFAIYAGMSRKDVINIFKVASDSNCKFLYVSPERLETALFKEYLPGLDIRLLAVDEAHCISQWGYDFRPPYLRIAALRQELPHVPVLALTASATPEVQKDIIEKLEFTGHRVFHQSFERPNLSYSAFKVESKINKIIGVLVKVNGSAIIYCKSRKRCKEISDLLQMKNISSDYYHAGLPQEERNKKQEQWINNHTRVIVCTNAFGMGIDKPDVRIVVHADVPDCLEHYYQEAGRAGRDGKIAYAVLLYDDREIKEMETQADFRFPGLKVIQNVYQSAANYLQIPAGSGEGEYYDFDLGDFIYKFKLNSHTALYSLKALEQDGWLAFNEQVFLPPAVGFTTDKDYLNLFEKENPSLEPIIKTLLRAYEGIFDHPVPVSEKLLAGLLKKEVDDIKKQLSRLHQAGIISYQPQKDTPQLLLLRPRIKSEDVSINIKMYEKRKELFQKRTKQMVEYVLEDIQCRSRIFGYYFGDQQIRSCCICDSCLRQKAVVISNEEFETIYHRIINMVTYESFHTKDLLIKLNGVKKEKAWKVLDFLQAENKIEMNADGWIRLK